MWNPFRSKLAAAILGGVDKIHIKPGSKVLYLGAASGTTVSHVADIVGPVSSLVCGNVGFATPAPPPLCSLCVCVATHSLPSPCLHTFFTICSTTSPITVHLITTSPHHHFTSSPLHLITTSPHHHFTSSPLHLIGPVTSLVCGNVWFVTPALPPLSSLCVRVATSASSPFHFGIQCITTSPHLHFTHHHFTSPFIITIAHHHFIPSLFTHHHSTPS